MGLPILGSALIASLSVRQSVKNGVRFPKAREIEGIRARLIQAEQSGFTTHEIMSIIGQQDLEDWL